MTSTIEKSRLIVFVAVSITATLSFLLGLHHQGGGDSPWWHAFTYQWCHCNVWHLIANIYCVWMIVRSLVPVGPRRIVYAYIISIVAVLFSVETQGLSGIIYALLGMLSWQAAKIRTYHFWMMFFLGLGLVLPNVNFLLHLLCYGAGLIVEMFHIPWRVQLRKYWS